MLSGAAQCEKHGAWPVGVYCRSDGEITFGSVRIPHGMLKRGTEGIPASYSSTN